jgi:uncharacterized protein (TIGR03086 family)
MTDTIHTQHSITMGPVEQFAATLPMLTATVRRVQGMQLDDPTPCTEFTVHGVIDHMIVLGGTFTYLFRGEQPPELAAPVTYGWVPVQEFTEVMEDLLDAMASPGALDRIIEAPGGTMPGEVFARFVALDGLVHGWDLATATGQTYVPLEEVVVAVDEFARDALGDEVRAAGLFAPATSAPSGASRLEQLIAFTGRSV